VAGEYRALLKGTKYAHIRLARTDVPMHGVTRRLDLRDELIALFDGMKGGTAQEYAQKLRVGKIIPITEDYPNNSDGGTGRWANRAEKNWAPGELFFRS